MLFYVETQPTRLRKPPPARIHLLLPAPMKPTSSSSTNKLPLVRQRSMWGQPPSAVQSSKAREAFCRRQAACRAGQAFSPFFTRPRTPPPAVNASHRETLPAKIAPSPSSAQTHTQACTNSGHPPVDALHFAENTRFKNTNFLLTLKTKSVKT